MKVRNFLAALCLMPVALSAAAGGRITVSGQASVDMSPDLATISLGVTNQAPDAAEALAANTAATAAVLETIRSAGVEPGDIQTSGLSLSPNWTQNQTDGNSVISGFVAGNQVTVQVRDLDLLGGLLDQVVRTGANTFNGLTFGLQDTGPAMDEARRRAVADALATAGLLAEAAGVTLGPIAEINGAGGLAPQPMIRQAGAMMEAAVPVAEGQVSVSASVTVVFEISD